VGISVSSQSRICSSNESYETPSFWLKKSDLSIHKLEAINANRREDEMTYPSYLLQPLLYELSLRCFKLRKPSATMDLNFLF
jgi:hypothetical protein